MAIAAVASAEDADGNPLYPHKWDANKLDLPTVATSKQGRPSITAETMAELAGGENPRDRMVLILAASTGCRIGELLGLEIKDLLDDFTAVRVIQQAKGTKLTSELKTANSVRFVDICPETAAFLKEFLAGPNLRFGLSEPHR
jgi:integrase